MLSQDTARRAAHLRELLETGTLYYRSRVSYGHGSVVDFDVAVRLALADLDYLILINRRGDHVAPDRWRRIGEEITHLHGLAVDRPPVALPGTGSP